MLTFSMYERRHRPDWVHNKQEILRRIRVSIQKNAFLVKSRVVLDRELASLKGEIEIKPEVCTTPSSKPSSLHDLI